MFQFEPDSEKRNRELNMGFWLRLIGVMVLLGSIALYALLDKF